VRHFTMHSRRAAYGSVRPLNCGVRRHSMRIASFFVILAVSLTLAGQEPPSSQVGRPSECPSISYVCVRIENSSDIDFDRFQVHFPEEVEDFGGLPAGAVTAYRRVGRAYDYNYTEAASSDRRFVLLIIDHVGDRFLPPGSYTYRYRVQMLDEPPTASGFVLHGYLYSELEVDQCQLVSRC